MRGFLTAVLVLVALERIVSVPAASSRVAGLFRIPGELAQRFLDPNVPALGGSKSRPLDTTAPYPSSAPATPSAPAVVSG